MNSYPHQRQHPAITINGHFGPYDTRELEAARAQLIHDLYSSHSGGILTRVKMKCGIYANSRGKFTGCEPHPVTNVSFESQSCSLMMEDPFPWKNDSKADDEYMGNAQEELEHYSEVGRSETIDRHDTTTTCTNRARMQEVDIVSHLTNSNQNKSEEQENVEDLSFDMFEMRKSDSQNIEVRGIMNNTDEQETSQPSTSASSTKRRSEQKPSEPLSKKRKLEEKEAIIVSSDDDTDLTLREETTCYKCDLCYFIAAKPDCMKKHLKESLHFSASRYTGLLNGHSVIPKYLVKRMELQYKPAQFKSIIPVCPKCHAVFSNIHSCYTHNQLVHGAEKPLYALGTIKKSTTAVMYRHPKCHKCDMSFDKISRLNTHMKAKKHHIYQQPESNELVMMLCVYCEKKEIFTNLYFYQDHLRHHHDHTKNKLAMKIDYVEKPTKIQEMLPRSPRSQKEGMRDDIQALHILKHETRAGQSKIITSRIQELRMKSKQTRQNRS